MDIKKADNGYDYIDYPLNDKFSVRVFDSVKNERLDGETFMEYKVRRLLNQTGLKAKSKGRLFWPSINRHDLLKGEVETSLGTYNKQQYETIFKEVLKEHEETNITTNTTENEING